MPSNTIVTGEAPEVVIEQARGDLVVRGWQRTEVQINSDTRDAVIGQSAEQVRMRLDNDAVVQIPAGSRLRVERLQGDGVLNGVTGAVHFVHVRGDLALRECGPLTVERIEGDMAVRSVHGDCLVGHASSDVVISRVLGSLRAERVQNDLSIFGVRGAIYAVGENDVTVHLDASGEGASTLRAGNDLDCRIPMVANVRVEGVAGNRVQVRGAAFEPAGNRLAFQLGEGTSTLSLEAGDDLTVRVGENWSGWSGDDWQIEFGPEFSARMAEVAAQIEGQVTAVARQIEEKINSMGGSEEVATRLQEKILSAARRAEEKINEMMKGMEARAREAERRAADSEQRQRSRPGWPPPQPPVPPTPPRPPKAPRPPVSEEERLLILRMVSEGKISVEQAEKLLAALNAGPGTD